MAEVAKGQLRAAKSQSRRTMTRYHSLKVARSTMCANTASKSQLAWKFLQKTRCSVQDLFSDFDDGFGPDLMGDEDDRARLASMSELDREMELADRAEKRDKELERRRTARVLKQQHSKATQV